jgi:hypothetical protein
MPVWSSFAGCKWLPVKDLVPDTVRGFVINVRNFVEFRPMPTISQLIRKPRTTLRVKSKSPALAEQPAKAWCLHSRVHHDA